MIDLSFCKKKYDLDFLISCVLVSKESKENGERMKENRENSWRAKKTNIHEYTGRWLDYLKKNINKLS